MATQSPFLLLDRLFERALTSVQPPQWLVHEVQHRLVLFLNHVVMQESLAMERLQHQSGRVVHVQWRFFSFMVQITPAGLFNLAAPGQGADLRLEVMEDSPLSLASSALRGQRPSIRIDGDVQLAAEMNWLVDHVRWDVQEDLARLIGDTPAHTLASLAGRIAQALRGFVGSRMPSKGAAADPFAPSPAATPPSAGTPWGYPRP